jgi:CubicO group peptidase (beta-lactamase class C family)
MERWLKPALDYVSSWIEFQMRASQQPGCVFAVAHRDRIVLERAIGYADIVSKEKLTPRHRFRVASHSKSFVAAGLMKLREQRKLSPGRFRRTVCGQAASASRGNNDQRAPLP